MTKEEMIKYIELRASGINQAVNYNYKEFYKEMLEMCEQEKSIISIDKQQESQIGFSGSETKKFK